MIGIIGALKEELKIIKGHMIEMEKQNVLGSEFCYGKIFDKDVVVCESSIGKVNASIVASAMILKYKPKLIVNTGIAGGMSDKVKIMDVVVANQVIIHDEGEIFIKYYPYINRVDVNKRYIEMVKKAYIDLYNSLDRLNIGGVITGDEFVNSDEKRYKLKKRYKDSLAVDMECGAIGKVCYRSNTNLVIIKTISDGANDESDVNYDKFINMSANKSAKIVLKLLENKKI